MSYATLGNEKNESVERGIDVIPESERDFTLKDIFFIFMGSQMCLGVIVVGALPIVLGLSFWASVLSITVGVGLGSLFFGPLAPFGAKTGTSGSIASGAHFGVKGSVLTMYVTILIAIGFYVLTVWTGGEALIAGGAKLLGWEISDNLLALGASIICLMTIVAAIYGHNIIVKTETVISYTVAALLLITAIALFPQFDASYAGGELALGAFWPTWILSTGICASIPVSYATFVNDYSRFIPSESSKKNLSWAAGGGMFVGCWLAFVFATYVTSIFTSIDTPFVSGMIDVSPSYVVALIMLIGIFGSQPQGSLCLYTAGLGFQGLVKKLSRVQSTLWLSVIGFIILLSGIYLFSLTDIILGFVILIESVVSPWLTINLVGFYWVMRGNYRARDFFDLDDARGSYWYSGGWNIKAIFAWSTGSLIGLMFSDTAIFTGPWVSLFYGAVPGWALAGFVGGLMYFLLERQKYNRAGLNVGLTK